MFSAGRPKVERVQCIAEQAEDLYHDAQRLPDAATIAHLLTRHKLQVSGPLYHGAIGSQNDVTLRNAHLNCTKQAASVDRNKIS